MRAMLLAAALAAAAASPASAQGRSSWELAPGVIWFSGMDLGSSTATLERPGGGDFDLFKTDTTMDSGLGASAAVSFHLSRRIALEAAFSYARPSASTRVTDDAEGAETITSEIGLQQYLIEGNLRWYLTEGAGWRPFVRAGGGYLRQLDDSSAHVETGHTIQAGFGADRAFRDRASGTLKRAGVRLDGRVVARSGGFDVSDSLRIGFSAGAALFLGF